MTSIFKSPIRVRKLASTPNYFNEKLEETATRKMPFTSRKSRVASNSIKISINSSSSRLNPFSRLRSDPTEHEQKLPPTSNPFGSLSTIDVNDQGGLFNVNGTNVQLNELQGDLESLSISVFGKNHQPTHHPSAAVPQAIQEEDHQDQNASDVGWLPASKKHKRKNSRDSTHESRHVVRAAGTNSSTWLAPGGTGIAMPRTGYGARRGLGNIFFGVPLSELVVGAIIFHHETRECYDEKADPNLVFKSNDGQLHYRKGRFFVIEAVHAFTLTKSPMYSCQGRGLEKKNEEVRKEHVGVRSPHIPPDQYVQQNRYGPLEVESMNDEFEQFHEKTVLRFTERSTITFDTKVRIVGRLTSESTDRLKQLRADFGC